MVSRSNAIVDLLHWATRRTVLLPANVGVHQCRKCKREYRRDPCRTTPWSLTVKTICFKALFLVLIGLFLGCTSVTPGNSQEKKADNVTLEPFIHKFYWESFNVTLSSPASPDMRYRLMRVQDNGWVEMIFWPNPSESQIVIAKPPSRKFENDEKPPTIVVAESNPKTQTATLKELRMK